jgi:hypothetical protein
MSKQPESLIVNKVIKYIESMKLQGHRVKVRKRHGGPYGTSGEPDIEACIDGKCVQIEMKVPGNKPTILQLRRMSEWSDAGALVNWFDNYEATRVWLEHNFGGDD